MPCYGGRYNATLQSLSLIINTPVTLPLPQLMPIKNVGTATANSLTIKQAGVYEINYMFNASSSLGAAVSLSVRKN